MIFLVLLLAGWADPPGPDLALSVQGGTVTLRLAVTLNGRSPELDWDAFLDRLFDQADGDGDRNLTAAEALRVLPVSLPNGKQTGLDFARADADQNARVTREEFRAHYRGIGFLPLATVSRPPTEDQTRLAGALFSHLDRNGDGKISAEEWKGAPALMARFDDNEDEFLDPRELVVNTPSRGSGTRDFQSPWGTAMAKPDAKLFIEIADRPETKLESGSGLIRAGSTPRVLEIPGGRIRIKLDHTDPAKAFRASTREFFLALFAEAAGKKQAMKKSEMEAEPSLAAILGLLVYADRNGDGVLTTAELESLFDLVEMGLARQVTVVWENRGQNLFDWLDDNADGRLDIGELNRAAKWEPVLKKDLPWSYHLLASRGPPENHFGPLRVPLGTKPAAAARSDAKPKGPAWFQAMDKNLDGFVSRAEFRGRPETFDQLDSDKDGRISVREAEDARR